ncbi:heterokaryon incompatibility protein-domain-containing protein [Stachybotrys elegans]|uniref:Heterokaryon incompatibility protein-domain-containing protein n=1 Tax=Stachybotrys elegans TaxID=80388 RepID=A0A8K0SJB5_9HYPO|nr:heterokaryon incompatibility protein-domain-containing protein [Stachybotrys elegans]
MSVADACYPVILRVVRPVHVLDDTLGAKWMTEAIRNRDSENPTSRLQRFHDLFKKRQAEASAEPETTEWYRYGSIGPRDIRLLRLKPGSKTDDIHITLTTHSVDDGHEYEALSYTWGDASQIHYIRCHEKLIQVTKNLFEALHHLRYTDRDRIIWIDAVCINQGDIVERGAQVQLMCDIYKRAKSVVVWLGEATNDSTTAINLMKKLHEVSLNATAQDWAKPISEKELKDIGLPEAYSTDWAAIEALYCRQWFRRIWIIQEISLARSAFVQCGEDGMPWPDFATAASYMYQRYFIRLVNVRIAHVLTPYQIMCRVQDNGGQEDLISLLFGSCRSFATNAIDHVYGLLGLASDKVLIPDYAISVQDAYRKLANAMLLKSSYILNLVGDPFWNNIEGLSSWVPDFSSHQRANPFLYLGGGQTSESFFACRDPTFIPRFSPDGKTLWLRGVMLDKVRRTGKRFTTRKNYSNLTRVFMNHRLGEVSNIIMAQLLRVWEQIVLDLKCYPTGEDVESVCHSIMVAGEDVTPKGIAGATMAELYALFRGRYLRLPGETTKESRFTTEETRVNAFIYYQFVYRVAYGRRLFSTKKGYAGLGPNSTKAGDCVVLLNGGRTAYILRPRSKKEPVTYQFLGEAYVHGVMNGEGFALGLESKEFTIL